MKRAVSLHAFSLSKQLAFTAVFAALCCIGTIVIVVPLPTGYFNAGDVFVLLAGWCLGPLYGSVAAAVGSALADVISGFPVYAPATFFIKGSVAFLAFYICFLFKKVIKKEKLDCISRALSAVISEAAMVLGYFVFEWILYGLGGATGALLGNVLQRVCCGACAILLIAGLYPAKSVQNFFPSLTLSKTGSKN